MANTSYTIDFAGASLTIIPDATITSLSSSANPSDYGAAVTILATVSAVAPGAGTPTGTVQFQIDGTNFGPPVDLVDGLATSEAISTLALGNHTLTASYSGDNNFDPGASAGLIQTVNSVLAVTSITPVAPDPRTTPVSTIDVAFNVPINTTSAATDGVTLTDHGNSVAASGLSFTLVPGTASTYLIGGLSALTAAPGTYVFTINAANIDDQFGNAGAGSLSTSWVVIPTSVYISSSYASDAPGTAVTWTDGTNHFIGVDAFGTIQAGINAVAAGGAVNVGAGTFSEQLTIDQSLSLFGAGTSSATILAPASSSGNEIEIANGAAVTISGVTLDGANCVDGDRRQRRQPLGRERCHHRF